MKFFIDVLFGIFFAVSLAGLGVFAFNKVFRFKSDFITGFFAGCGIMILLLLIAGLLGVFSRIFFIIIIIAVFLFSLIGGRALFRFKEKLRFEYLVPLLILAVVLVLAALSSLSPPIKNDTLFYHLGLPKLWSQDSGISFYPWLSFSATALSSELLLTPIVSFVSPEAAQFFVFLIGLMVIMALGRGALKYLDIPAASAIMILVSVSFFVTGMSDVKNDYLAAGFALLSFLFYIDYLEHKDLKYIAISGIFAGLAASTKANSLIFAAVMVLILLFSKPRLKDFLAFLIPCMLLGSPWFIRSYIETGNPFYPFFNGIFHSPLWRDVFVEFNRATNVDAEHRSLLNFITAPFRMIYAPDIFRARIGPLPLILLPLLVLVRGIPQSVKKALWVSLLFFPLWYIAWPNGRYLMPIIIILCLAGAFMVDWLIKNARAAGIITIVFASALIALSAMQIYRDSSYRIKAALGIVSRHEFLLNVRTLDPNKPASSEENKALPYYDVWQFVNIFAEPDSVVGILCSNWYRADGFYLDRPYIYLNPSEQTVIDFTSGMIEMGHAIAENNIRYILLDKAVIEDFLPDSRFSEAPGFSELSKGVSQFVDIVNRYGAPIYSTDRFELYLMANRQSLSSEPFSSLSCSKNKGLR